MNFFDEAALRLKQQLQVKTDKEVAEALGLSAVAWVGRKKRSNFPEVELYALAAKRPDLKINVEYVLTGQAQPVLSAEGRDHYLAGQVTALETMVQALLLTHPQAQQAKEIFMQQIQAMEGGLVNDPVPGEFMRGLRAGAVVFRLLPVDTVQTPDGDHVPTKKTTAKRKAA